ncbi:NAD(P)/FAD-dependent oxidoreductase [Jiulongibacter sediminis]|uniref:FAD dependent oxidoreductase domain-containing protein n=1 Tax=Jiulongibacter sediminis TaxID=1605367 RepID=A0A0P7C0F4_9BACT|nr:FAD-dependent oxidoreductase [Jiulongibacter sediminis]KPM48049.1 hypothetical protein AFM12_12705 [Jiulongibacter sediminis]TBX24231.1 hypothetical protein TK44_12715 [Jiulongibacter sediminis]
MIDFLIVGQGLAGTTLAYQLLKKGASISIIDNPALPSSSRVAGGMFNPVTGKHLAKTWLADELYPYLFNFYREIENLTGEIFLYEIPIYRPFKNEQQKAQFEKLIPKHQIEKYCKIIPPQTELQGKVLNPLGGVLTEQCGRLDVEKFLDASKGYFDKLRSISNEEFDYKSIEIQESTISYKGNDYQYIIFCEGFHAIRNPFFKNLPFNPVKGETLDIKLNTKLPPQIINQGKWLMPLEGSTFKAGATYVWHELNDRNSEEGKQQIEDGIRQFLTVQFEVIDQKAGVRPATKDRRPFAGLHPEFPSLGIFNGLGTKGVSLAPYLAANFADHLLDGKEINTETTIDRLNALY